MTRWHRFVSGVGGRRLVLALGALYLAVAAGRAARIVASGGSLAEAVSTVLTVGVAGLLILYGGYRLPETGLHPQTYPRVVTWTLGGCALLVAVVGLRMLSPGVTIDDASGAVLLGSAIGTVGGLGIGLNEARALTRAEEAQQRSRELERTKAELERRNRTLQRTQAELEATVAELRSSNERLEQFAYGASHDLQEPLRMVSSYLRLLESRYGDDFDDEAEEFIEYAVDGADRMRAMVASLLEYSRVTTRDAPTESADAEDVLANVLDDLQLQVAETDATITADELPVVRADADQLAQVFQNLLSNALKYSGDAPPRVHVGAEYVDDEWRFSVADEGIGIESEYQSRVFSVFEQLHTAQRGERTGAVGIGLSLCERIVEHHGGDIWVESEPGEGATFYFTLPTPPNDSRNRGRNADGDPTVRNDTARSERD